MKTLTLRIDDSLDRWVTEEAKRLGQTRSEIIRNALVRTRHGARKTTLHDRMQDLCGTIKGAPRDITANTKKYMKGFGE